MWELQRCPSFGVQTWAYFSPTPFDQSTGSPVNRRASSSGAFILMLFGWWLVAVDWEKTETGVFAAYCRASPPVSFFLVWVVLFTEKNPAITIWEVQNPMFHGINYQLCELVSWIAALSTDEFFTNLTCCCFSKPEINLPTQKKKPLPAPSKGCQLNPKGWWIDTRYTEPFGTPTWRCWLNNSVAIGRFEREILIQNRSVPSAAEPAQVEARREFQVCLNNGFDSQKTGGATMRFLIIAILLFHWFTFWRVFFDLFEVHLTYWPSFRLSSNFPIQQMLISVSPNEHLKEAMKLLLRSPGSLVSLQPRTIKNWVEQDTLNYTGSEVGESCNPAM